MDATGKTAPPRRSPRFAWAALCLALLLGALALSFWAATKNFAIADPVQSPETKKVLEMARVEGDVSRVMFSRYFASESNRALFTFKGPFQAICALLAWLLAFRAAKGRRRGALARALLATVTVVAIALAAMVPQMIEKGRAIDFVPREPPTAERAAFMRWHGVYMVGDALLLLASLALLPLLMNLSETPRASGASPAGDRP
ncbi:MAG: hypothetical protein EXS13_01545 [Planctomycetes bacterium]|nr:hypothetical protein [Planctomycetota bacterium]